MGGNSINTIRLLAAFEVLYGHVVTHLDITTIPVWVDCIVRFFLWSPCIFYNERIPNLAINRSF